MVIIFLIAAFIILIVVDWGFERSGLGGNRSRVDANVAGVVNGENISRAEFDKLVKERMDEQRQGNPDAPIDEEQIREQVWQDMISKKLIEQAANRLGIGVTDDQLVNELLYNPPQVLKQAFMDSTGTVFRQRDYFAFMQDPQKFLIDRKYPRDKVGEIMGQILKIQDAVRFQMLAEGVQDVVTASGIPSPAELRRQYDDQKTKASGTFVMIDPNMIPDSAAKVSDDEAHKYFDAHKMDFQQKASREFRYVMFTLTPSAQDSSAASNKLKNALQRLNEATTPDAKSAAFAELASKFGAGKFAGSEYTPLQKLAPDLQAAISGAQPGAVIGPIRLDDGSYLVNVIDIKDTGETFVRAQHILFKTDGKNDDSVKAQAEKILARAKGGEDFGALASQYSADPGSASKGGDLGYFQKDKMVKEFADAAFGAQPGSIVGPVKSQFGYHIIKVNERSSKNYKLRDIRFDARISKLTETQIRAKAQQFRDKLNQGVPIDTLAAQMKLQVLESGPLNEQIPAAGSMKLTRFAYDGKVGSVSEVIDLKDRSMVVAQVSKVRTPGAMDFADAKEGVILKLRMKKKLDMIQSRAQKLRSSLTPGDSLSKLTAIDSTIHVRTFNDATLTTPFQGVGFDYPLSSVIFSIQPGKVSDLIRGDHGYYITMVSGRTKPTDQEFASEKAKFSEQYVQQKRQELFSEWIQKEREHSKIQDNWRTH
ncbi:MAG: peptidylprolyl isomerase [Bacteroidetes bacterium]|nr:peptidylprolyl isomerase [Bacteroidota bacterium]